MFFQQYVSNSVHLLCGKQIESWSKIVTIKICIAFHTLGFNGLLKSSSVHLMMQTKEVDKYIYTELQRSGLRIIDACHECTFSILQNTWIGISLKLKAQYCCRVFHSNKFCLSIDLLIYFIIIKLYTLYTHGCIEN